MRTFKDGEGREWTIRVTVSALERVRDLAGIDLGDQTKAVDTIQSFFVNPVPLVRAVAAIIRPQVEKIGLAPEDVEDAMRGQSIADAREAFFADFADFLPPPMGPALKKVLAQMGEQMGALEAGLSASGKPSTSTPELSVSIPQT